MEPASAYDACAHASRECSQADFARGYEDAGGPTALLDHFIHVVIPCESGWDLDPSGAHVSAAQFSPDTWARARRTPDADSTDPYEVGFAVGSWLRMITEPGGRGGWPVCFWRK